jgi:NAD(P)-dependent dehydrogenase (short-subunit alcohol dehydrogenase family)
MINFGASSTALEVVEGVDLSGKLAVITGASGGIGIEAARALAAAGATVVLGNRDPVKAEIAAGDLRATVRDVRVELGQLDLTSLASVRRFAASVADRHDSIDLLINNAGVMATPFERTADGFELQFGTNHLAHFLLTKLLTPQLLAAGSARVVNLSSNGHAISGINWDDPNYANTDYAPWPAYGQSKTANILFTIELERRLGGQGVHAFAVHPGVVATDLFRYLDEQALSILQRRIEKGGIVTKHPQQGASTTVYAATSLELEGHGGSYLEDCRISDQLASHARDPLDAARLWTLSERLVE